MSMIFRLGLESSLSYKAEPYLQSFHHNKCTSIKGTTRLYFDFYHFVLQSCNSGKNLEKNCPPFHRNLIRAAKLKGINMTAYYNFPLANSVSAAILSHTVHG